MKKILFLATVFVAGAATASIAQFSNEKSGAAVTNAERIQVSYKDTTKPVKDTVPSKKDSTAIRL